MLARWDPFVTMTSFERDIDEFMRRFLTASSDRMELSWRPATEVFRDGDQLVVRVELPGIDPEKDLEVAIEGNVLHIRGHRSFDREIATEDRYLVERAYGEFRRDIALPEGVDADELKAEYVDGVLTVTVPLPESVRKAETRKIPVVSKVKSLIGGKK